MPIFLFVKKTMEIKKISLETTTSWTISHRPQSFTEFIWQSPIKSVLQTAIESAKLREAPLGHILFSGSSGFGKTTLATIISQQMNTNIKVVTGYALTKPSELVSLLNSNGRLCYWYAHARMMKYQASYQSLHTCLSNNKTWITFSTNEKQIYLSFPFYGLWFRGKKDNPWPLSAALPSQLWTTFIGKICTKSSISTERNSQPCHKNQRLSH